MRTLVTITEVASLIQKQSGGAFDLNYILTMVSQSVESLDIWDFSPEGHVIKKVNSFQVKYPVNANNIQLIALVNRDKNGKITHLQEIPEANTLPLDMGNCNEMVSNTGGEVYLDNCWTKVSRDYGKLPYERGSYSLNGRDRVIVFSDKSIGKEYYILYDAMSANTEVFPRTMMDIVRYGAMELMWEVQDANKAIRFAQKKQQAIRKMEFKNMPSLWSIATTIDSERSTLI